MNTIEKLNISDIGKIKCLKSKTENQQARKTEIEKITNAKPEKFKEDTENQYLLSHYYVRKTLIRFLGRNKNKKKHI